ncbi:MAG TPA: MaoC family dehydratase [Ramlibacter sp.]|nr:MaoC family dehydratase [Ramlibacter sp.]
MTLAATGQLFGEDLVAGTQLAERRFVLDAQAFRRFSELTGDNHPIHEDTAYAQARGLRAPIAHGLLLVAMTALGGTTLSPRLHDSMLAMLGTRARFQSPAFIGDAVTVRFLAGLVQPKDGNRCVANFDIDLLGDDGRAVAAVQHQFLLRFMREKGSA